MMGDPGLLKKISDIPACCLRLAVTVSRRLL
jgi:hypothetical protein